MANKRALPSKEAGLFKELLTLYETRQLKKGLKTADLILKKFPEHGETLCMKGLVLTHMGRRGEGIELVKKGMRLDLTSHICWHVFGLIQKGEKNYEEALKSYTQALRFDKENLSLLRDYAHMQCQLRMYDGLVDTRHTLLRIRPNLRQNWVALAIAYHLNGNLQEAKKVIEHYHDSIKNVPDYDVEHSETLLYHVRLLEDMSNYAGALEVLDPGAKMRTIVDKTAIMEFRARLLSKSHSEGAVEAWRSLVDHNPESYDYYKGYLAARGAKDPAESLSVLQELSTTYPKARAPRRISLNLASSDQFKSLAEPYLSSNIAKGIPSLFADVKALYSDDTKRQAIEEIVETVKSSQSPSAEDPTVYLWTLYFLAQHYSHLGRHEKALELLDTAIAHTPTLPELYTCRARALKRAGDIYGAANALSDARLLDGQDRFLNTKCAKYRLRAGQFEEAHLVLGLFTKKDAASPAQDLEDMQSLLYLLESGNAYRRTGNLNMALKRYQSIQKIFDEVEDDQFDFHGYCVRKFTANAYLSLLTWADQMRSHPAYVSSVLQTAHIFVAVFENPALAKPSTSSSQLTEAEKKALKKAKKQAQKNHTTEDSKKQQQNSTNEDKGLEPPAKDDDPDGKKLLASSDPLERSWKLLEPLMTLVPQNIDVWLAVFDVSLRRRKFLQAIKALNYAKSISPDHPGIHVRTAELQQMPPPPEPLAAVFKEALLPPDLPLERFNSEYVQKHPASPAAIVASAKVSKKLGASKEEFENLLFGVLAPEVELSIAVALDVLELLALPRKDEFRIACDQKFPLSTVFKDPAELKKLAEVAPAEQTKAEEAL